MNLYVRNLPAETTPADLRELFRPFGPTTWADVWSWASAPGEWVGGIGLTAGWEAATAALNGTVYRGRLLAVGGAEPSADDSPPDWE